MTKEIDFDSLSDAARKRHGVLMDSAASLTVMAKNAINNGCRNNDFVAVCIKVDSKWRWLVDKLMPNTDWDNLRKPGMVPIARGIVRIEVYAILIDDMPDLKVPLEERYPMGSVKAIVLDDSGGTVYQLDLNKAQFMEGPRAVN